MGLLIQKLNYGLTPAPEVLGTVIWGIFIVGFAGISPGSRPTSVLAHELADGPFAAHPGAAGVSGRADLPDLRVARGVRLVKALGASMRRRGFGYVVLLTLLVTFAGAAGMLAFERETPPGTQLDSYGEALWWTAMLMTTLGSEYWPQSVD